MNDHVREGLKFYALITDAFGGHGGISVFNKDLIRAFLDASPESKGIAVPRLISRPVEGLPERLTYRLEGARGTLAFLTSVFRDLAEIRKADVIYCAHLNLTPLAWLLRLLTGRPVLCALYGIDAWTTPRRSHVAWAAKRMTFYYSISDYTRRRFMRWSGLPEDRIDLLPNAIHLDAYSPGAISEELAQRLKIVGEPVAMTFGRLVSRERAKGFDEMLDILPKLIDVHPRLVYIIAGDGEDRERLTERVRLEGLTDHVVFTGFVDEADKADLYRLADLYVMPSRGEGFGFVFLEALACGVPVVASSVDGSRDAVRDGLLGEMVDPDRPDQLLAAVIRGLEKPKGYVPEGLAYFGYDQFVRRANAIARKTMAA